MTLTPSYKTTQFSCSISFELYMSGVSQQIRELGLGDKENNKSVTEGSCERTRSCYLTFSRGCLTSLEYAVLSEWFDYVLASQKVDVDLFVYLRAPPEVCYNRIRKRNRKEETGVPFDFIKTLHTLHEDWLINQTTYKVPGPVLILDASHELPKMMEIYEAYKSEILFGHIS